MSVSKDQDLLAWKVVRSEIGRNRSTWRGNILSKLDHNTWCDTVVLNAMVLNDLSPWYDGIGDRRILVEWCHNVVTIDLDAVGRFLSDAVTLWRDCSATAEHATVTSYNGFKRRLQRTYPFAGAFLAPIRRAMEAYFMAPTAASFYPPYQFLSFMTHLSLRDIDLSAELEQEFVVNEERISQHRYPPSFVSELNSVMKEWLREFATDDSNVVPCHGPGSVFEYTGDRSLAAKYARVCPTQLQRYVFRRYGGLDLDSDRPLLTGVPETGTCAEIVLVPKSMKTMRIISKEPATFMYLQKGIAGALMEYIHQHPYLGRRINFDDQALQQDLAIEASRTGGHATVDLSAASDSITYELVKRVFHGTALYPYLVSLRSRSVLLPSGKGMEVAKFAPMGSALCFPVQTLIFACIVECTSRYVHATQGLSSSSWRVYGDDIIVPDRCLNDLVVNLGWCAFRTNPSKTYGSTHRFKESCGMEAYDGSDVTPMKIGRRFSSQGIHRKSPGVFSQYVTMVNECHHHGFHSTRRFLLDRLLNGSARPWVPLFSGDSRVGVYTTTPTNYRVPRRWNRRLQREEVYVAVVKTTTSRTSRLKLDEQGKRIVNLGEYHEAEMIRYFETLRRISNRQGDLFDPGHRVVVNIGTSVVRLVRQWVSPVTPSGMDYFCVQDLASSPPRYRPGLDGYVA